jgi:hypothetical protein
LDPPTSNTTAAASQPGGAKGTSFHPQPPAEGEASVKLPGNVILPYVPPHPANSNPRKVHRYLLTVFEQTEGKGLQVDLGKARQVALKERQEALERRVGAIKKGGDEVPAWEKNVLGAKEEEMLTLERGQFPTWGFAKGHAGLKVAGYGFFTSGWNLYTSDIYTRLGESLFFHSFTLCSHAFIFFGRLSFFFFLLTWLNVGTLHVWVKEKQLMTYLLMILSGNLSEHIHAEVSSLMFFCFAKVCQVFLLFDVHG